MDQSAPLDFGEERSGGACIQVVLTTRYGKTLTIKGYDYSCMGITSFTILINILDLPFLMTIDFTIRVPYWDLLPGCDWYFPSVSMSACSSQVFKQKTWSKRWHQIIGTISWVQQWTKAKQCNSLRNEFGEISEGSKVTQSQIHPMQPMEQMISLTPLPRSNHPTDSSISSDLLIRIWMAVLTHILMPSVFPPVTRLKHR